MSDSPNHSLGFSYQQNADNVHIRRDGHVVTVLRGKAATEFVIKVSGASTEKQQQLMARATGNYKRGNERQSKRRRT